MNGKDLAHYNRFGQLYNKLGIQDAWRYTDELSSYTSWALDLSKNSGQVVPMLFNTDDVNTQLNLQAVPGNIAAYPFLRYIDITAQKRAAYLQDAMIPKMDFNNFTMAFPAGISTQTSNVTNLDSIKKLLFNTIPASVTITDIQIARFGTSSFVDLFPTSFTASGTTFNLEDYFGSGYGATVGDINVGFIIKVTANNGTGGSLNVNMTAYGITHSYQNNVWLLDYMDATGQLHRIGTFNDAIVSKTFYLDRLITVPITDPTRPNFGNLLWTLQRQDGGFSALETYDMVVSMSIAYLLSN